MNTLLWALLNNRRKSDFCGMDYAEALEENYIDITAVASSDILPTDCCHN